MKITTIGLDIAKNVFQVHGIDAAEKVVVRKQLRRGQMPSDTRNQRPQLGDALAGVLYARIPHGRFGSREA